MAYLISRLVPITFVRCVYRRILRGWSWSELSFEVPTFEIKEPVCLVYARGPNLRDAECPIHKIYSKFFELDILRNRHWRNIPCANWTICDHWTFCELYILRLNGSRFYDYRLFVTRIYVVKA